MKKLFYIMLVFALVVPAFAETLKVSGYAPTVNGSDPATAIIADQINSSTTKAFNEIINELNGKFTFNSPTNFLQAMGNSSVYASHGATTRGYSGYKLFSVTVGATVGLQLPESLTTIRNDIDEISDSLKRDRDIKLGFSPNVFNINVGLSLGALKFLPERLGKIKRDDFYIGLRAGYFKFSMGDINYNNLTLGATVNYQIIPTLSLAGLVKWRGINLGTGFIYNGSAFSVTVPLDNVSQQIENTSISLEAVNNKVNLNMDLKTFTIPLEAVTAIKLLIFNIPLGIGADIAFGKTSLGAGITSDLRYSGLEGTGINQASNGNLSVAGGVSGLPSIFNFKIITGFGLNFGPVVFDVPLTIYPAVNGYTVGITAGAVF